MEIENFSWNETKEYFIVVYDIFSRRNEDEFLSQLSFTQQVFQVLVFIYKYFKNFNYNKHEWFKE